MSDTTFNSMIDAKGGESVLSPWNLHIKLLAASAAVILAIFWRDAWEMGVHLVEYFNLQSLSVDHSYPLLAGAATPRGIGENPASILDARLDMGWSGINRMAAWGKLLACLLPGSSG